MLCDGCERDERTAHRRRGSSAFEPSVSYRRLTNSVVSGRRAIEIRLFLIGVDDEGCGRSGLVQPALQHRVANYVDSALQPDLDHCIRFMRFHRLDADVQARRNLLGEKP